MANIAFASFKLDGLEEVQRVLRTLPQELQDKVMRTALTRAAKPAVDAAKMFASRSVRTGALRESIGAVVKKGRRGGSVYAIVGPLRGYYKEGKALAKDASRRGADQPANYAHLVEYGHIAVAPKKGTSLRKKTATAPSNGKRFVAPKPFLRPALLASTDRIVETMAQGVAEGIEKQRQRLVKNPGASR